HPHKPKQQIGDLIVIGIALGAIPITGLADAEGPTCERDTHTALRHCFLGQLSALRWPRHLFPRASFSRSACMLKSAYIRFNRRFSSSRAFIWLIIEASIPPYFARHLMGWTVPHPAVRLGAPTKGGCHGKGRGSGN